MVNVRHRSNSLACTSGSIFKMPTLGNGRSLVKSIEMLSGLQLAAKGKLFCLLPFSEATMNAEAHSAPDNNFKVIQGTIENGHNKTLGILL